MVLLLHGFLLAVDTFEGSFYPFSMSQEGEAYREVFSLLMNAPAQFIKCGCSVFPGPRRNPGKERGTDRNRRVYCFPTSRLSPTFDDQILSS
jgi:hypothetical protein